MNSYLSQLFGLKGGLANYVQSSPFHVTSLMHRLKDHTLPIQLVWAF